ncbi:hypothetical protein PF001_g16870 [Phytophthora fragariae]|uniref:Uncharacterized protein n=2 Tax=Phytophthora fragariae TaxID=53985 RepID=A0A6A4D261_9STRA|nr:hypothetical protein PF006_g15973 [Phytophthora fragariae]KAE9296426.1 hypothetical protein PF001_g16870 [Phytophthora fragariae]
MGELFAWRLLMNSADHEQASCTLRCTLIGEPQLRSNDQGSFFDVADDAKRRAWQAIRTLLLPGERLGDIDPALRDHVDVPYRIPHWRLTQTSRNLASELQERLLLSVFRFLRFTQFFWHLHAAIPSSPSTCLTCFAATKSSTTDQLLPSLLLMTSTYPRSQTAATSTWSPPGAIPGSTTSRPDSTPPGGGSAPRRPPAVRRFRQHLAQAFTDPGAEATVDLGTQAVAYVTPRGTKTSIVPAAYAWRLLHPSSSTMVLEEGEASPDAYTMHKTDAVELALLTRTEADLTPGN